MQEAENSNLPVEHEMPHENKIVEDKESTNQNGAINKESMEGKNASEKMKKLKRKTKRQQPKEKLRKEKEWLKQLKTVLSESEEEINNEGGNASTDREERKEEADNQEEQKQPTTRRWKDTRFRRVQCYGFAVVTIGRNRTRKLKKTKQQKQNQTI